MAIKHTFISRDGTTTANLTPVKAIRQKCLDCSCWSFNEVTKCAFTTCALYPFRFGKNVGGNWGNRKGNPGALKKYRRDKNKTAHST